MQRKDSKNNTAHGAVSNYSLRTAKSGNFAHEFNIGAKRFSLFIEDNVAPFQNGDHVGFSFVEKQLKGGSRNKYLSVLPETLELSLPTSSKQAIGGYVYVLSNPALKGLLKVGHTTGTPENRAAELSAATGVPRRFKVELAVPINGDSHVVERSAHAILASSREGKEFFRTTLDIANNAIREAYALSYPEQQDDVDSLIAERMSEQAARKEQFQASLKKNADEAKVKAFWLSPEGRWLTDGTVKLVLKSFNPDFDRGRPNLVKRLFSGSVEPWLEFEIIGRNGYQENAWRAIVNGAIDSRSVSIVRDLHSLLDTYTFFEFFQHKCNRERMACTIKLACSMLKSPCSRDFVIRNGWDEVPSNSSEIELLNESDQSALRGFIRGVSA